jgi:hypothetical protein
MINETAIPAPIGTAKNAGEATNFERMPTAGFAASIAPSRASFSSRRSPSDSSVSASSPLSERKNVCKFRKASSFVLITLYRLSDIVLIDEGLHDTIELCFVAKNALQELIEVAMRIAAKAVSDGIVAYIATGFLEISDSCCTRSHMNLEVGALFRQ